MKKLLMATKNPGKVRELRKLLNAQEIEVLSLADLQDTEDVDETGDTFRENAIIKATHAFQKYGIPAVADDSGIMIHYLADFPGVWSARFLSNMDYSRKNRFLVDLLKDVSDRKAVYVCGLAYVDQRGTSYFEEVCEGEIALEPVGENGFGYDPVFFYPPEEKTMAQLDPHVKNAISHRGKALRKLVSSFE